MPYIMYDKEGRTMFARATIEAECELHFREEDEPPEGMAQAGWLPLSEYVGLPEMLWCFEDPAHLLEWVLIRREDLPRVVPQEP